MFNAARAVLHTSGLPHSYWEVPVRDAAYKYKFIMHSKTKQLPFTMWFGQPPETPKFYIFGQVDTIPHFGDQTKLRKQQSRDHLARYLHSTGERHIAILNVTTNRPQRVRSIDFTSHHRLQNHSQTTKSAFKSFTPHPTHSFVTRTTPAPLSRRQAAKYPDASEWATAHNNEVDQIDRTKEMRGIAYFSLPPGTKLIPLQVGYRYKRNQAGDVISRKAQCVVRGDKMLPRHHYDPDKITTYIADRTSIRLLFPLAAASSLQIEHFDIESAYIHEISEHTTTVYLKHPLRFGGSLKHPCKAGILEGNL